MPDRKRAVIPRLRLVKPGVYAMWCPGCMARHEFDVHALNRDGHVLGFDGDMVRPTIGEPVRNDTGGLVCEFILRAGSLHYFSNCTHGLVGMTVPLPHFPLT